jgi:hypothetical protein
MTYLFVPANSSQNFYYFRPGTLLTFSLAVSIHFCPQLILSKFLGLSPAGMNHLTAAGKHKKTSANNDERLTSS